GAASAHTTTRKRKVRPGTRPPICRLIYVETSITSAAQGTIGRPPAPEELDMTVRSLRALAASCVLVLSAPVLAEEGMWMPRQVPDLAGQLADKGYKVDTKSFSNLAGSPMGAVVSLGGCSASFVSPDGLIITNHHCVRGALQYNATPERDLLKDGFLAKARGDELPAGPGTRASI